MNRLTTSQTSVRAGRPSSSVVLSASTAPFEHPLPSPTGPGNERQRTQARHEATVAHDERQQEAGHRRTDGILAFDQ